MQLRLARSSAYSTVRRPHRDDDFVVLEGEAVVGRILQIEFGPSAGAWEWSVTAQPARGHEGVPHGVAADLEAAKVAFKARWLKLNGRARASLEMREELLMDKVRERAARALCRAAGNPENTKFEGKPMWKSYLNEVDIVLAAANVHALLDALRAIVTATQSTITDRDSASRSSSIAHDALKSFC